MDNNGNNSSRFENITPEKAQLWLESVYEYQRPVRQWWANYLAREMHLGRFLPVSPIHFVFFDGKSHLINGQHTLYAIIKSRLAQELNVVRTAAKTDEELATYFFRFDQSLKRTFSDAAKAMCLPELTHLTPDKLNKLSSAIVWIGSDFGTNRTKHGHKIPVDDLLRETVLWVDDFLKMEEAITPCPSQMRKMIIKRSVLSIALITFRNKPAHALNFWQQVSRDDGLRLGDPRKALNQWLQNARIYGGNKQAGVDDTEVSRAIERAWNAYMESRSLKSIIVRNPNSEINLVKCTVPQVFAGLREIDQKKDDATP